MLLDNAGKSWLATRELRHFCVCSAAGKDATSAFTDVGHSNNAIQLRESFLIGHIADQYSPPKETVQT